MNPLFQLLIMYSLSTASLTTAVLHYTHPFFLLGLRMSLAGVLLLGYLALRNRPVLYDQITKQHRIFYTQIILFTVFIPYALRYYGLSLATNAITSDAASHSTMLTPLIYNLGPVITFFLAHIFGVEKISWQRAAALGVSFAGLLVCLDLPTFTFSFLGLPEYALILSLVSFSYGWIIMRKLVVDLHYNPLLVNGIAMFGGGVMGLLSSFYLESAPYISNCSFVVPLLITTIIISNIVGHSLYASLLRNYSLTLLQLGYWLLPAINKLAVLLSCPATMRPADIGAAFLLITGFALLYKTEQNNYATVLTKIRAS